MNRQDSRSLHRDELVVPRAESDFLSVRECFFPIHMRIAIEEDVVMLFEFLIREVRTKLAVRNRRRLLTRIGRRLIAGHGVSRDEHADVRQNRRIVFGVAVAVRRNVHRDVDVKRRPVLANCLAILGHLAIEKITRIPLLIRYRVERAGADAATTAFAYIFVDVRLALDVRDGIRAALLRAATTATTFLLIDDDLARRMLLHLARTTAAAHADVLYRAAEACHLVTFEMREADDDVRVHERTTNFR